MRSIILLPAVLSLASLAYAAPQDNGAPQASTPAQPAAEAKAKPAEPKKICRREAVAGSNIKEKICMTAEQWKRYQDS